MFDLSKSLSNWKKSLKNEESFTNENIEELENHLTEQISDLKEKGLSDDEAFWIAQKRIGGINSLKNEFEKVNYIETMRKKIVWLIVGAVLIGFISYSINIAISASYALGMILEIDLLTWTYSVHTFQILFVVTLFGFVGWLFTDNSMRFSDFIKNNLTGISRIRFLKYFSIFGLIYNLFIIFMWKYGLQWINVWQRNYAASDIYREHLDVIRQFNVVSWIVSSFLIILVLIFANRKTFRAEPIKA